MRFVDCKSQFRCKGTVFSPYMQILAAKNAVYLRFLAANGIFTVIQYVKERFLVTRREANPAGLGALIRVAHEADGTAIGTIIAFHAYFAI